MSKVMKQLPFGNLMEWALTEYAQSGSLFGMGKIYQHTTDKYYEIFGEKLELPFGPAAGPHTQLSQNLVTAYAAGGRFFELKTVQILDGEDLPVSKPCILAKDEGYNVEWSTELYVPQAMDEYIRGWFALKLLSKELGLGASDGFDLNMSVGYDLEGIKT
jgi:putative selenate reductase